MDGMTSSQRLALSLAAAALLIGGFFVAQGSDEDTVTTAPGTPAVTSATAPDPASAPTGSTAPTTAAPPKPAEPAVPLVVVRGGRPVDGVKDLTFKKGEKARFAVRSDVADEIHLHGYDLKKDVSAGGTVTFSFTAKIDGIFEVELENAGVQIASLKVTP